MQAVRSAHLLPGIFRSSDRDTLVLALANINFDAALTGSTSPFVFTYRLNVTQVDETYHPTAAGIFYKLDVTDQKNWYTWSIVRGTPGPSTLVASGPFPNPFVTDGRTSVFIPASAAAAVHGTLSIFSASMNLVYATAATSSVQLGRQVFSWNGVASTGDVAQSGVYFYVVDLGDQVIKGKFALIRK